MIGIIDFGSKKTPDIESVCLEISYLTQVLWWDDVGRNKLELFDKIILSGAPVLLTEINHQYHISKFSFLKNSQVPVLGICFGHQLLGLVHGAEAFMGEAVREWTEIKIKSKNNLFKGFASGTRMMEDHTEGITLPDNFKCLATSDKYEVEAMKHISKPIYGVQFHPEVSGKEGKRLLNNFLDL